MKRNIKKTGSFVLCLALVLTLLPRQRILAVDFGMSVKTESYIVLTSNDDASKTVVNQYEGEEVVDGAVVTCELTENQADMLEQQSGVIAVEEDILLGGCTEEGMLI